MSVLEYLAKVDFAAVQFERAKRDMEAAKMNFDRSKQAYEEVLTQSETLGLSKAKLKRVAEERVAALLESGLIDLGKDGQPVTKKAANESKSDKSSKNKKKGRADAEAAVEMAGDTVNGANGADSDTDDFDAEISAATEMIEVVEANVDANVETNVGVMEAST